jgi:hypothetical protein
MSSPIFILTGVGFLAVTMLVILTVIIVGIHHGDGHLSSAPKSHSDAFARRVLTGARRNSGNTEDEDQ